MAFVPTSPSTFITSSARCVYEPVSQIDSTPLHEMRLQGTLWCSLIEGKEGVLLKLDMNRNHKGPPSHVTTSYHGVACSCTARSSMRCIWQWQYTRCTVSTNIGAQPEPLVRVELCIISCWRKVLHKPSTYRVSGYTPVPAPCPPTLQIQILSRLWSCMPPCRYTLNVLFHLLQTDSSWIWILLADTLRNTVLWRRAVRFTQIFNPFWHTDFYNVSSAALVRHSYNPRPWNKLVLVRQNHRRKYFAFHKQIYIPGLDCSRFHPFDVLLWQGKSSSTIDGVNTWHKLLNTPPTQRCDGLLVTNFHRVDHWWTL